MAGTHQSYLAGFLAAIAERPPAFSSHPRLRGIEPGTTGSPLPPQMEEMPSAVDGPTRLAACARENQPPRPADRPQLETLGCFYEAPERDAFRVRVPVPNGELTRPQVTALAEIAQEYGGGYLEYSPPGALEIPEVPVAAAWDAWQRLDALGLRPGAGPGPHRDQANASRVSEGAARLGGRWLSSQLLRWAEALETRGEAVFRLPGAANAG